MIKQTLILSSLMLLLSSCASTSNNKFTQQNQKPSMLSNIQNINVNWPGYILKTIHTTNSTCFEIAETTTDIRSQPKKLIHPSKNRYIACQDGILSSKTYNKKLVTVTGQIMAFTKVNSTGTKYVYPIIEAENIRLWSNANTNDYSRTAGYHNSHRHGNRYPYNIMCNGGNCYYN